MDALSQRLAQELLAFQPHQKRFVLSVSGGRDSVALLYLFYEQRSAKDLELCVYHVNFGLRGKDSDRDERFVAALCRKLSIPCAIYRVSERRELSQEQAREIRIANSQALWPDATLVEAHHQDDQIESFLFRLLRGTGLSGLRGMRRISSRGARQVFRPFLDVPREWIEQYIQSERIDFVEDHTNAEDLYTRNWIRNKLLKKLRKRFENFRPALLRLQNQIGEEEDFFEQECRKIHQEMGGGASALDLRPLRQKHPALVRRFLVFFFKEVYGISLDRAQVLELSRLLLSERAFVWNAPKNWVIRVSQKAQMSLRHYPGRGPGSAPKVRQSHWPKRKA